MNEQLKPATPDVVPHGDWTYVDPDSGMRKTLPLYGNLKEWARQHRKVNNYPIGIDWDRQFDTNICQNSKLPNCKDFNPNAIDLAANLDLWDIVRGTGVLLGVVGSKVLQMIGIGDGPLVSQEEANQRAEICAPCGYNVAFSKPCSGICEELKQIVVAIKGNRSTPSDQRLNACKICRCFNQAQVWVKGTLLARGITDEMREKWPDYCWKKAL